MNETRAEPVRCAGPGAAPAGCEREGSVRGPPGGAQWNWRGKKFVWSFFEGNNKNPRPRRRRRHLDLLCAQVAASQAVTHPAGFLRIEKGATMEDARRPERDDD